jgi:hypothetical protein
MLRRIAALLSGAALLLLSRWSLRVARPTDDLAAAWRVWWRVEEWARDCWTILWRAYGPVTTDMRTAWERLRERYRGGAFGLEGT